jgi:hypothetical protein
MKDLAKQGDPRMTIKEVAEVLGVTEEAIKKHVRELWPNFMRNGVTTYLSETQVTEIKKKMIPTTKVVGSITDLEAAEMLIKSAEHFKSRFEQERQLRIEAERDNARLQIRCDTHETYLTVKRVAKLNHIPWSSLDWRMVKRSSQALELEWKKADDLNYGNCNAYHVDAWRDAYPSLRYSEG